MPGKWDATIKAVYAVDSATENTIDVIASATGFDVIADVEIGERLIEFGSTEYTLYVSVRNLSQFVIVSTGSLFDQIPVAPGQTVSTFNRQLRVSVPAAWAANDGDALDVIASFRVVSGSFVNTSVATSSPFVVSL